MSHDMIVFGEDWGAHPSSTQHLIRQFLPDRRVIWVNSLGLRAPRLDMRDGARMLRKLTDLAGRHLSATMPAPNDENAVAPDEIIAPAAVPLPGNATAAHLTRTFVARQVNAAMNRLGMKRPILWTSLPTAEPLVGAFGERAVVYYAGDDFGALEGVDHKAVLALEERLVDRAELILAASPEIAQRFPAERTMVAPHGVDVAHFSRRRAMPADMHIGRPVVGFYGSISGWIDIELIARAARALPKVQFVMIGQVSTDIGLLEKLENVHFLGPKRHQELPAYVQHFDVAMLPFRDTPQIRACNPLKLREYLASGAAVASTDFPALEPYRALIHVGQDADGFIAAIEMALKDKARMALRQRAVQNETWSRRAEDIAAVIDLL
jgi:glycosyltransferase involved in cell wall biosynthesis